MGIDKSLTDDFPSVVIGDQRYHYGRETTYGQYLVEDAEYAKNYWVFNHEEDLLAFLVNLPESADSDWIKRRHPDWLEVTHEQRLAYMDEHNAFLRKLMEEKRKEAPEKFFNVLCFDQTKYFSVKTDMEHRMRCDDVDVEVRPQAVADGKKELLIDLKGEGPDGEEKILTICRAQALKLATALIKAAVTIESGQRLVDEDSK